MSGAEISRTFSSAFTDDVFTVPLIVDFDVLVFKEWRFNEISICSSPNLFWQNLLVLIVVLEFHLAPQFQLNRTSLFGANRNRFKHLWDIDDDVEDSLRVPN